MTFKKGKNKQSFWEGIKPCNHTGWVLTGWRAS